MWRNWGLLRPQLWNIGQCADSEKYFFVLSTLGSFWRNYRVRSVIGRNVSGWCFYCGKYWILLIGKYFRAIKIKVKRKNKFFTPKGIHLEVHTPFFRLELFRQVYSYKSKNRISNETKITCRLWLLYEKYANTIRFL